MDTRTLWGRRKMLQQPVSKAAMSNQDQLSGSACGAGVRLRPPVMFPGEACLPAVKARLQLICSDNNAITYTTSMPYFRQVMKFLNSYSRAADIAVFVPVQSRQI